MILDLVTHRGACHCGNVRFEVDAPADLVADECNCSICAMTGFQHLIVESDKFRLLTGNEMLCEYTFNTGNAKHLFCEKCGIKAFYVPRSHPGGYSVNVRCLDPSTVKSLTLRKFDGKNWEQNVVSIR